MRIASLRIRSKYASNLLALINSGLNPYAAILMNVATSWLRSPYWTCQRKKEIHQLLLMYSEGIASSYLVLEPVVKTTLEIVAMRDSICVVSPLSNNDTTFLFQFLDFTLHMISLLPLDHLV